jgi:hypothetical protein
LNYSKPTSEHHTVASEETMKNPEQPPWRSQIGEQIIAPQPFWDNPGIPVPSSHTPSPTSTTSAKAVTDKCNTLISMIPVEGLERVGRVFVEGLRYGKNNWKKGVNDPDWQEERLNHAIIHMMKWANGNRQEDHLAKVAWFCLIMMWTEEEEKPYTTSA